MPITTKAALSAIGENAKEKACEKTTCAIAVSAYQMTTKPKLAEYQHQSLFAPPTSTVLKAIENNQLENFPTLDEKLLKFLLPSTATHKGHMYMKQKTSDQGVKNKRTSRIND